MSSSPKKMPVTFYTLVYSVVREVPRGRLATYGWVASWLGRPRAARAVGYALAAAVADDVPWQRIINARGTVSVGGAAWRPQEQIRLLRREGICIGLEEPVDFARLAFQPSVAQLRRWHRQGTALVIGTPRAQG